MKQQAKTSIIFVFFLFSLITQHSSLNTLFAQAPKEFNYQAVARDGSSVLDNATIDVRFDILQGSAQGTSVWNEIHSNVTTNALGLFSLKVGSITTFTVDWTAGPYFLNVQLDLQDGSGYRDFGNAELLSVPFALFAQEGNEGPQGEQGPIGPAGTGLNNQGEWTSGMTVNEGDYVFDDHSAIDPTTSMWIFQGTPPYTSTLNPYADQSNWIEFQAPEGPEASDDQQLSIIGQTLSLERGGSVLLPVDDADPDPTNEIQDLVLSGDELTLTMDPTPVSIDLSSYADNPWTLNGPTNDTLLFAGSVAIGPGMPNGSKLAVQGDNIADEKALFEVKRQDGQTVFAVYNSGVRMYVEEGESKGRKGGFAIGGFTPGKGETGEYFRVTPDSVRIYLDTVTAKRPKGGFAIGGFTPGKGIAQEYLRVTQDSTRIYIDNTAAKGSSGGFAIGGYNASKGILKDNYFSVSAKTDIIIVDSASQILWYPLKDAFLAGTIHIGSPDSVGYNSTSIGYMNTAMGQYSQAFGFKSKTFGNYSTAIGYKAECSYLGSMAIGYNALADSTYTYALGNSACASGYKSYALGYSCEASGVKSYAIGSQNRAMGETSYAIGHSADAFGNSSMAFGRNAQASGYHSIAIGVSDDVGGYLTDAAGNKSIAIGTNCKSRQSGSTTLGFWLDNNDSRSTVVGRFNSPINSGTVFIVGNGTDNTNRNNAVTVLDNGNIGIGTSTPTQKLDVVGNAEVNGNIYVSGDIYSEGTSNLLIGKDNGDAIDFRDGTDYWKTDGNWKIEWAGSHFGPYIDNDMNLGRSDKRWKTGYFSSALYTGTNIEVNHGASGNRNAYIDFTGDDTYTDYGLRLRREPNGPNSNSGLVHRGTGMLYLMTIDAGTMGFYTSSSRRMTITSNGYIGIGTSSPAYPLHVETYRSTSFAYGYLNSAGNTGTASGASNISIFAQQRIRAQEFNADSDIRIKNVKGVSDSKKDLELLKKIKITDYQYIDTIEKGTEIYKKVIAQELQEIYPSAITVTSGFVPSVYSKAVSVKYDQVTMKMNVETIKSHQFELGDKIKLIHEGGVWTTEVTAVTSEKVFVVKSEDNYPELFVFGKEVHDFLTVDYEAIAMLNVSTTQELIRNNEEQQETIEDLKEEINKLKTEQSELALLKEQMKELRENMGLVVVGSIKPCLPAGRDD